MREDVDDFVETVVNLRKANAIEFLRHGNRKNRALKKEERLLADEEERRNEPNQEPMVRKEESKNSKSQNQKVYTFEDKELNSEEIIEALRS